MVITLDRHKKPIGFTTEKHARQLMEKERACVYRYFPFVIIIKDRDIRDLSYVPSYRVKTDPGSKDTGLAIVCNETDEVVLYLQIRHRGSEIAEAMLTRANARRNRRSRETGYRHPKWRTGSKSRRPSKEGWLPPCVKSIGDNVISIIKRLRKYINITACSFEAARFDTQLMDDPGISGEAYQHGTLYGYELREYLMEHYRHTCQYCGGASGDPVLEWEHKVPKSRGGSDSVRNASLACSSCNRDKGAHTLEEWLSGLKARKPKTDKEKGLAEARIAHVTKILSNGNAVSGSSRYAAWANALRRYEERGLFALFGEVECASGGRTKYNRAKMGLPKDHHYDALSVGSIPERGYKDRTCGYVVKIKAMGRGRRLRGLINNCGVITVKWADRAKRYNGLQTGDIVRTEILNGKYKGAYTGRVMIRKSGRHDIRCLSGDLVTATKKTLYKLLQRSDGYSYGCMQI